LIDSREIERSLFKIPQQQSALSQKCTTTIRSQSKFEKTKTYFFKFCSKVKNLFEHDSAFSENLVPREGVDIRGTGWHSPLSSRIAFSRPLQNDSGNNKKTARKVKSTIKQNNHKECSYFVDKWDKKKTFLIFYFKIHNFI